MAEETLIRVEILDGQHVPLEGFTVQEADVLEETGVHRLSWQGKSNLEKLAGKTVRLRFLFQNAKLYSFQFR